MNPTEIKALPITISFGTLYDILFRTANEAFESQTITDDLADAILLFQAEHKESEDIILIDSLPDTAFKAWRKECWLRDYEYHQRQRERAEKERAFRHLQDEARQTIIRELLVIAPIGEDYARLMADAILYKKDKFKASKFGINGDEEKWKGLFA